MGIDGAEIKRKIEKDFQRQQKKKAFDVFVMTQKETLNPILYFIKSSIVFRLFLGIVILSLLSYAILSSLLRTPKIEQGDTASKPIFDKPVPYNIQPSKYRTFTENDFRWDEDTYRHKSLIVKAVNKIHRENSKCLTIENAVFLDPDSEPTDANPKFFVMCGQTPDVFNVFFSKSDVENGRIFSAVKNLDRDSAIESCEEYARINTRYPNTLDFNYLDTSIMNHGNGNTTVTSSFTAKNTSKLQSKYRIRCLFISEKDYRLEANIIEEKENEKPVDQTLNSQRQSVSQERGNYTSREKTQHVSGYTRKNGTYVHSYNRRPSR